MAKRLVWSARSRKELFDILSYWDKRIGNRKYSKKLYAEIRRKMKSVLKFNDIGKATSRKDIRTVIIKDYILFYKVEKSAVEIISVWDNRRNPKDLKLN